jgi:hypothetical protein
VATSTSLLLLLTRVLTLKLPISERVPLRLLSAVSPLIHVFYNRYSAANVCKETQEEKRSPKKQKTKPTEPKPTEPEVGLVSSEKVTLRKSLGISKEKALMLADHYAEMAAKLREDSER